jgi:hypothetical protein
VVHRDASLTRSIVKDARECVEYAVGTVAAVAFATILYKVVTSGAVVHALTKIVTTALQVHL